MKKTLITLAVFALIFGLGSPAMGAEFFSGQNPTVPGGQTVNSNAYAAGGNVDVSGAINGDLYSAGGSVIISGKVQKDLVVAGGNLTIMGDVGDDLRIAGGNLLINSKVGGEVLAAGGQIMFTSAVTSKNVYAAGGSIVVKGTVDGDLWAAGQKVEIDGTVNGNAKIQAAEVVIGDTAVIKGTLSYAAPNEGTISKSAKIGKVEYTHQEYKRPAPKASVIFGFLVWIKLLLTLVFALIVYFIFRKGTTALILGALNKFWIKLLIGLVVMIVLPIVGIIVAITIVGLPFSVIATLIYFTFAFLSSIAARALLGTFIFALFRRGKTPMYEVSWLTILIGIIVYSLIRIIPIVGWLAALVLFLPVFGEMWRLLFEGMKRLR